MYRHCSRPHRQNPVVSQSRTCHEVRRSTVTVSTRACCREFLRTSFNRRQLLKVGIVSGTGLTLSRLLEAEARGTPRKKATARSCIFLYQVGGPSHLDTFDPKPDAP